MALQGRYAAYVGSCSLTFRDSPSVPSLTLNLLTITIVALPSNASKWQMGFNSAFKWLTLNLLTTTIVAPPSNASKWQMGFNSAFKGLRVKQFVLHCWILEV
jgi:hypothetical protein